jgi:flagellar basal-body rod protein FlgB
MFEKLELTRMAQGMASHAGARLGVVAANIANADTPGYKVRDLRSFAETYAAGDKMRATRPGHLGAPLSGAPDAQIVRGPGAPNGNTVNLETEMVRAVEVRRDHEMALAISRNTSEIVRASLGRRG